jgi:hypothetical protein
MSLQYRRVEGIVVRRYLVRVTSRMQAQTILRLTRQNHTHGLRTAGGLYL